MAIPLSSIQRNKNKSKKIFLNTTQSITNIKNSLVKNTREKKIIFNRSNILKRRGVESQKRRYQETMLELPNISNSAARGRIISKASANSTKGFFERIIESIAYLGAGWMLDNLPMWLQAGENFIKRVEAFTSKSSQFFNDIKNIFVDIGGIINAGRKNLLEFDFNDQTGRMEAAIESFQTDVNIMIKRIQDSLRSQEEEQQQPETPETPETPEAPEAPKLPGESSSEQEETPQTPQTTSGEYTEEDYRIAAGIYTEGGEGQSAVDVMQVLANRVQSPRYPNNYTDVLTAGSGGNNVAFAGIWHRPGGPKEFRKIKTLKDAARWAGTSESVILRYLKDLSNQGYINNSRKFVKGAFEFRAAPGYYLKNGLVPGEMGPDGRFYGSSWRGGPGDNQFLMDPVRDKNRINPQNKAAPIKPIGKSSASSNLSTSSLINPVSSGQQPSTLLASTRRRQKIVVIDDSQTTIASNYSNGGGDTIIIEDGLNSYNKAFILTQLAYT